MCLVTHQRVGLSLMSVWVLVNFVFWHAPAAWLAILLYMAFCARCRCLRWELLANEICVVWERAVSILHPLASE